MKDIDKTIIELSGRTISDNVCGLIARIISGEYSLELCRAIREAIRNDCREVIKLSEGAFRAELSYLSHGSSTCCYIARRSNSGAYIYKQFHPFDIPCESCDCGGGASFYWISDEEDKELRERFLKRFVRFIRQAERIAEIKKRADEDRINILNGPQMVITSMGYALKVQNYFGDTLDEAIGAIHYNDGDNIKNIRSVLKSIALIISAAQDIDNLCHRNRIVHGDIKPENFIVFNGLDGLERNGRPYVSNIDFDTCVNDEEIKEGYIEDFSATTPLYYKYSSPIKDFEDGAEYDVQALSEMLMYALDNSADKGDGLDRMGAVSCACGGDFETFDWLTYFFGGEDSPAANLYKILNAEKLLAGNYIYYKIKDFLYSCSVEKYFAWKGHTCKISGKPGEKSFLSGLEEIEDLLSVFLKLNGSGDGVPHRNGKAWSDGVLRVYGLHKLQNDIKNVQLGDYKNSKSSDLSKFIGDSFL